MTDRLINFIIKFTEYKLTVKVMKNLVIALAMMTGLTFYGNALDNRPVKNSVKSEKSARTLKKQQVSKANLPKDARQYIKENFPANGFVYAVKQGTNSEGTIYEVGIAMEDKLSILEFDAKGETLSERMTDK
ncbi:hypothetical protein HYN48_04930 [Flavobacterium magnum]|uniref:PepSY domain-containing protein n=2 Tax=Flavobacterium magnum TaxID=2162713 RepID=A0A2S0RCX2_9FLAO|nr:hypothetical protein HYN48_04930 [Flavobacterium magnum]